MIKNVLLYDEKKLQDAMITTWDDLNYQYYYGGYTHSYLPIKAEDGDKYQRGFVSLTPE